MHWREMLLDENWYKASKDLYCLCCLCFIHVYCIIVKVKFFLIDIYDLPKSKCVDLFAQYLSTFKFGDSLDKCYGKKTAYSVLKYLKICHQ